MPKRTRGQLKRELPEKETEEEFKNEITAEVKERRVLRHFFLIPHNRYLKCCHSPQQVYTECVQLQ